MKNFLKLLSAFLQLSSLYLLFTSENNNQAAFSIVIYFCGIIFLCFSLIKEQSEEIECLKNQIAGH